MRGRNTNVLEEKLRKTHTQPRVHVAKMEGVTVAGSWVQLDQLARRIGRQSSAPAIVVVVVVVAAVGDRRQPAGPMSGNPPKAMMMSRTALLCVGK